MIKTNIIAAAILVSAAMPASAGNTLIAAGAPVAVAKSKLTVKPSTEWNKLGARPGKTAEIWTLDGGGLNKVTFYGGIPTGMPLLREVDKKNRPLPKVPAAMLVTDIPTLVENTYRIAFNASVFELEGVEPAKFAGADGVSFRYSYVQQDDELPRKGEARAAIIGGKLFMMTYDAPTLHYFEKSVQQFRQAADTAKF